jgi:EAL domain-containing protein (putative c-di-GMP-specific phosphodiesterase class I)
MPTVLIVDDEPAIRRAVARVAESAGFQTLEAQDGREALAHLDAVEVDAIVSDIEMPVMGGIELLQTIAMQSSDVPVVLLTGHPTIQTATQAVSRGAFEYVLKPFDPTELRSVMRRAVHLRQVARLRRQALAVSRLPGGRAEDLEELHAGFEAVLGSLRMAYQPIVDGRDHTVFGYEALLRSDVAALPHPGAVLHAAEYLGRLHHLGRVVRERSAVPFESVSAGPRLFVNLHADDLLDPALFDADAPLSRLAGRVVLEITERADLHSIKGLATAVARLREMGFWLAVDDLGAGYAGLASFATLRPEIVKLDMSLVRGIDGDPLRRSLAASIAQVGADLGIAVIAEGVESAAERDVLLDVGVRYLQGYLFARPGPPFPEINW